MTKQTLFFFVLITVMIFSVDSYKEKGKKKESGILTIKFNSGVDVKEGNEIDPLDAQYIPSVKFDASKSHKYTLIIVDKNFAAKDDSKEQIIFLHWLKVNIEADSLKVGNITKSGNTLADYAVPVLAKGDNSHRYYFYLYEQSGPIVSGLNIPASNFEGRKNFSPKRYAREHSLGRPVAQNSFFAKFE